MSAKTKTAKLKPCRMWANYYEGKAAVHARKNDAIWAAEHNANPIAVPVVVIPLDDVEGLVRKAGDAFAASHDGALHRDDIVATLRAIGIPVPVKKEGRK